MGAGVKNAEVVEAGAAVPEPEAALAGVVLVVGYFLSYALTLLGALAAAVAVVALS